MFLIELLHAILVEQDTGCEKIDTVWQGAIEIDVWQVLHHSAFENYQWAARLVQRGWADVVLLAPTDNNQLQPVRYLDYLRGKDVLWHKGAFNPVTSAHLAMPQQVLAKQPELETVLEISLNNFDKAERSLNALAHQIAMLALQPWMLALSRKPAFYRTREWLSTRAQVKQAHFVCGTDLWERILMPGYYQDLPGGLAEGLERLLAQQTQIWICEREGVGMESQRNLAPPEAYQSQTHWLGLKLPIASSQIRRAIAQGRSDWQTQVPADVADYIQQHLLYQATD